MTLLQHPNQLDDLKADPSLAKAFVEELCRFHTASAMATRRVAKVDITLGGKVGLTYLFDTVPVILTCYFFFLAYQSRRGNNCIQPVW